MFRHICDVSDKIRGSTCRFILTITIAPVSVCCFLAHVIIFLVYFQEQWTT